MAAEIIKNIYLFKECSQQELSQVQHIVQSEVFNPGDEIFSQNDRAIALYIVKMGTVKIEQKSSKGDVINLATFGSGSHFGEMSFLDHETRSATVSAVEKTEILKIDYQALKTVMESHAGLSGKIYKALACFLCGRLRVTTTDLSFAREKNLRHF
jgi:CRP/FNR family cyclic AMP-dependent transcriptional regulator